MGNLEARRPLGSRVEQWAGSRLRLVCETVCGPIHWTIVHAQANHQKPFRQDLLAVNPNPKPLNPKDLSEESDAAARHCAI